MNVRQVELRTWPGSRRLWLRELDGTAERQVVATDTCAAIALIDALLVDRPGASIGPGSAASLDAASRDHVLAEIYRDVFGDHIESTWTCEGCEAPFDLRFSLGALVDATLEETRRSIAPYLVGGALQLPDGTPFRLPTGADELAVAAMDDGEALRGWMNACLGPVGESGPAAPLGDTRLSSAMLEPWSEALEACSAVLDRDLDAECAACGHAHRVAFSIQHFLLSGLRQEHANLRFQVHCLARGYGWDLSSILGLPRSDRLAFVRLLEAERGSREVQWL